MFARLSHGSARYALVPGAQVDGGAFRHAADRADRSDVLLVKLPIAPPTTGQQKRATRNRADRMAITTRVRHPGAANFSHAFIEGTSLYVVCPAPAGVPLRRLLVDGCLDIPTAVHLGQDLLEVLDAAHAAGQVHGWIEPDMVWVTAVGRAHILGFGVRELAAGLRAGDPGGSGCRAPEVLAGAAPDAVSDLYSIGAILCYAVYGRPPDAWVYQIPGPFGEAVRQMLSPEPSARPGPDWVRNALAAHVDPLDPAASMSYLPPRAMVDVGPPMPGPLASWLPTSAPPASGGPVSGPPVTGVPTSRMPTSELPTFGAVASGPVASGPVASASVASGAPSSAPPTSGPPASWTPAFIPPTSGPPDSAPPISEATPLPWLPAPDLPAPDPSVPESRGSGSWLFGAHESDPPVSEPPGFGSSLFGAHESESPAFGAPGFGAHESESPAFGTHESESPAFGGHASRPTVSRPTLPHRPVPPRNGPVGAEPPTVRGPISGSPTSGSPTSELYLNDARTSWPPAEPPAAYAPPSYGPTTVSLPSHVLPPSSLPRPVRTTPAPRRPHTVRRRTLIGGGLAAVVAAGAGIFWATRRPDHPSHPPATSPTGPKASASPSEAAVSPGPPGTVLWSAPIPPKVIRRPRVVDGVVVAEGTNTAALRVTDGSTAWQLLGSSHHVTVAGDLLYIQQGTDGQRTLSAMRPSDGTIQSTANIADAIQALTVVDDTGYFLGSPTDGAGAATLLRAIDVHTGTPRWTFTKSLGLGNYPIVDADHVYVGGVGVIWAVDRATGAVRWQRALPPESRPSVRGLAAGLVIARGGGGTYGLDPATGQIKWKLTAADVPYVGSQAGIDGDTIYTGSITAPGYLRAVDAATGTVRWKVAASSPTSHAMFSGGVVYVTGGDTLDALDAATGNPKWNYALNDNCTVEPVAGDGLVFAATVGGHLHAVHTG